MLEQETQKIFKCRLFSCLRLAPNKVGGQRVCPSAAPAGRDKKPSIRREIKVQRILVRNV